MEFGFFKKDSTGIWIPFQWNWASHTFYCCCYAYMLKKCCLLLSVLCFFGLLSFLQHHGKRKTQDVYVIGTRGQVGYKKKSKTIVEVGWLQKPWIPILEMLRVFVIRKLKSIGDAFDGTNQWKRGIFLSFSLCGFYLLKKNDVGLNVVKHEILASFNLWT